MSLFDQKKDLEGVVPGARRKDDEFEAAMQKFGEDPAREWNAFIAHEQKALHAQARGYKEMLLQLHNGTADVDPAAFIARCRKVVERVSAVGG